MSTIELSSSETRVQPSRLHGPRLAGLWRKVWIVFWAVAWLISLAAFVLAIYIWYRWDSTPISGIAQYFPDVKPEGLANLGQYQDAIRQLGMSLTFYGGLFASLRLLSGIPYFFLSFLIVKRRSDRLMAVLFAIVMAVIGAAGRWIQANWIPVPGMVPWSAVLIMLLNFILDCSVIMLYAFPNGRFVPKWTRWFAAAVILVSFSRDILTHTPFNPDHLPGLWGSLPNRIFMLVGLFALAYRYRKDADTVEKQQIKWIVAGLAVLSVFYFAHYLIYQTEILAGMNWTPRLQLTFELVLEPGWYIAQFLLAVCIGLSVLRYRLWDIDLVINRILVYGSLTLLTMGGYIAIVAGLGLMVRGVADPVVFFLATGLVAILFEPLRLRLQRLVNRLMYGERDDPYAVLTRLSNTLEQSPSAEQVLPAVATTVGQALKVPYAAILVNENGEQRTAASYGKPQQDFVTFPLIYQTETIGSIRVAPRARGEEFSQADRRLLENIARQAGTAAQAVRLNAELIRSRAEIVAAREEERRRLRRDLHDGLGPILASQTLKMAAVRQLMRQNPERAETVVDDVIHQNETTVTEVRRLVYGLRPPALDELGLIEAVRDIIRRGGQEDLAASSLAIEVIGPEEGLPKLPAAVEVAAYRIALEGLTNAARHSNARKCAIGFHCEQQNIENKETLLVQIDDDGVGIPERYRAGVGLRSMRERAEELGGRLEIQSRRPSGTRITAWLPLMDWR